MILCAPYTFCVFQEPAVFVKTEIEEGDATQPEMISGRQASHMPVRVDYLQ